MEEPARTIIKALNGRETKGKAMSKAALAIMRILESQNESLRTHNIALQSYGKAIDSLQKSLGLLNTVLMEINEQLKNLGEDEQPKIGGTNGP